MNLSSTHPTWAQRRNDWMLMRDAYEGERQVKDKGLDYLPPTDGMIRDGMGNANAKGQMRYEAYKKRAVFPELVELAINALVGIMHIKPPNIQLPSKMEPLLNDATAEHEPLSTLLRRINHEQLLVGRYGLLPDLPLGPQAPNKLPFIATYLSEHIVNWDDGRTEGGLQNLNFVSLNESEFERLATLEWDFITKYRLLWLGPLSAQDPVQQMIYRTGLVRGTAFSPTPEDMVTPSIAGNELDHIPFQFIGTKDLVPQPDKPPMLGLANLCMAIYRGEADYRSALHQVGQDTLVISGIDPENGVDTRTGPGASIILPAGATAEYVGVNSQGIPAMRSSLDMDYDKASAAGASMLDTTQGSQQSGDALRIRVAAKTATLMNIAMTGAAGLERVLKDIAKWIGANPEEVSVSANTDFAATEMAATDLVSLMAAKQNGAPISLKTIHNLMVDKDVTEFDFEAEVEQMKEEEAQGLGMPTISTGPAGGDPTAVSDPSNPAYNPQDPAYDSTLDTSSADYVDPNATGA